MREARDVQTLAAWFAALESWDLTLGQPQDESMVGAAILRLTDSATDRLRGTGQGTGVTSHVLASAPAVTWMVLHGDERP